MERQDDDDDEVQEVVVEKVNDELFEGAYHLFDWMFSIEWLCGMRLISVDEWSLVRQVVAVFRRYVFLSNVYLNSFSICINYHIMNRQISLERKNVSERS